MVKKKGLKKKHIKIVCVLLQRRGGDHIKQPTLRSTAGKPRLLLRGCLQPPFPISTLLAGI